MYTCRSLELLTRPVSCGTELYSGVEILKIVYEIMTSAWECTIPNREFSVLKINIPTADVVISMF